MQSVKRPLYYVLSTIARDEFNMRFKNEIKTNKYKIEN